MLSFIAALALATPPVQPLPDHLEISEGFSTVICPSADAAERMFGQYHGVKPAPNNHIIDTDRFFEGLKATGCTQSSGPITIDRVMNRKTLDLAGGKERHMLYSGRKTGGGKVFGIVSEDGNNAFPRTELAEWLGQRSADGWLDARDSENGNRIFYRCDTPAQARSVVASLGKIKAEKAFRAALNKALAAQKCRKASDRYFVIARYEAAGAECGQECFIDLNALEARDRSGQTVGLVFDGSLM